MVLILSTTVWAEGTYDLKQMTPQLQDALNSRRDRFEELRALKAAGAIGENDHGYVEVLKPTIGADAIAAAENKDRKMIYQAIAQQNGLENAVSTIESVFAQVQRDKAAPGEQIQMEDGHWAAK